MKRYWSAQLPMEHWNGKPEAERKAWESVDFKITPDDVIEMQKIDADCNDCKHFKRGTMVKDACGVRFEGQCLKFDCATTAYPGQFTGHDCFEHRRSTPL